MCTITCKTAQEILPKRTRVSRFLLSHLQHHTVTMTSWMISVRIARQLYIVVLTFFICYKKLYIYTYVRIFELFRNPQIKKGTESTIKQYFKKKLMFQPMCTVHNNNELTFQRLLILAKLLSGGQSRYTHGRILYWTNNMYTVT